MEKVSKMANILEGINVDEEHIINLRFTDDVALFNEKQNKTNGKTFKHSKLRKSESWPKNKQGKDKTHDKLRRQRRHAN